MLDPDGFFSERGEDIVMLELWLSCYGLGEKYGLGLFQKRELLGGFYDDPCNRWRKCCA